MVRVNLLPTREARALRQRRRTLVAGVAVLCLAAGGLAAVHVSQLRQQATLEARLAQGRQTADRLRREAVAVRELEGRIQRQRQRNHAVRAWLGRPAQQPGVLRGLSAAAPDRLWLTRYAESGGAVVLEGRATDDHSIARFLRRLAPVVESPRLVEAGKAQGEQGFRRFVIHGEPPDPVPPAEQPQRKG